jgi:hypothetical protein
VNEPTAETFVRTTVLKPVESVTVPTENTAYFVVDAPKTESLI